MDMVHLLWAHRDAVDPAIFLSGLVQVGVVWLMNLSASLGADAPCKKVVHHVGGMGNSFGSGILCPQPELFASGALLLAIARLEAGMSVNVSTSLSKFLAVTRHGS